MKRALIFAACAFGAFGALAPAGADENGNLIQNGNLETGAQNWSHRCLQDGRAEPEPDLQALFDVADLPDHGRALHIAYEKGEGRAVWEYRAKTGGEFAPGQRYRLRFRVKYALKDAPAPGQGFSARLNLWSADFQNVVEVWLTPAGSFRTAGELKAAAAGAQNLDWTPLEAEFQIPDDAAPVANLGLYVALGGSPGELWTGDFTLEPVK